MALFTVKDGEIAKRYAQECANFAGLDFSERSIEQVDLDLQRIAREQEGNPDRLEIIIPFSRHYGSYVGEAYRRRYGGEWGTTESLEAISSLGIQKGFRTFWPWYICLDILFGSDGSIKEYYDHMTWNDRTI